MAHPQPNEQPEIRYAPGTEYLSSRIRIISTELPRRLKKSLGSVHHSTMPGPLIASFIGLKDREQFVVLHLDSRHFVTGIEVVATGTLSEAPVHPREVFKAAIANNSAAIILGHNHPSGDLTPSADDRAVYEGLKAAAQVLGIPVLDSVIVHGTEWRSLNRSV